MLGPMGSGKSVLQALMALQFRRYDKALVGGPIRAAALAKGGDWHDIGSALGEEEREPVAVQPLAGIDDVAERDWATDWIAALLVREKIVLTPEAKDHLLPALCRWHRRPSKSAP